MLEADLFAIKYVVLHHGDTINARSQCRQVSKHAYFIFYTVYIQIYLYILYILSMICNVTMSFMTSYNIYNHNLHFFTREE